MKEITYGEITLIEYDRQRIYEKFYTMKKLCTASLVFRILGAIVFTINMTGMKAWHDDYLSIIYYIEFYIMLITKPSAQRTICSKWARRPSLYTPYEKERVNNRSALHKETNKFPFALILLEFITFDIISMFFYTLLSVLDNFTNQQNASISLSKSLLSASLQDIFILIATIILIQNCKLMREEWRKSPRQKKLNEEKKYHDNISTYTKLIEQCGMRFFIKYYNQLARLPLRDIVISETYTPLEKEERLNAAKKIIDLNLTEFAINEILKKYGDILDETEIATAKEILNTVQKVTTN